MSLNPRLVYGTSSGFGRSGPYRCYPAMDLSVQAMAGVLSVTGLPDDATLAQAVNTLGTQLTAFATQFAKTLDSVGCKQS